jgi:hypothetical protein
MAFADYLGHEVMVQGNDQPLMKGVLAGSTDLHGKDIPLVLFEGDDEPCMVLGIVMPYDEKVFEVLTAMGVKGAWNYLTKFSWYTQARFRKKDLEDYKDR